jgi:hypothetical protein
MRLESSHNGNHKKKDRKNPAICGSGFGLFQDYKKSEFKTS